MAILSKAQFDQLRPNGTYSSYLSFVARRRGVTIAKLKSPSKVGLPPKQFATVAAQAAGGGGRPAPGAGTRGGGGGRASQTAASAAQKGHIKWFGKRYAPGDADELWMDMALRGQSYEAWAQRWPQLAKFLGPVSSLARVEAEIKKTFQRVGSPLARYAHLFVLAGKLSGFDPRFIAAFAAQESGWGRSTPANAPHNYWGWSVYTGNQSSAISTPFQQPESAFRFYGKELGESQYAGAKSVYDPKWAPYAADPTHEAQIASILSRQFGGNPNDIRFQAALR